MTLILSPSQNKAEAGLGSPKTSALHMAGFKKEGKNIHLSGKQEKSAHHLQPDQLCTQV